MKYVYGWFSGTCLKYPKPKLLFVYQHMSGWGVTESFDLATRFKSVQECIDHYYSKRAYPENAENFIKSGGLQIFDTYKQLQICIP